MDAIVEFFHSRYRKVFGKAAKRHVPVALALDFALDITGELVSNPDLFIASEKQTIAELNRELLAALEMNLGKMLNGLGHEFVATRAADGGIDWIIKDADTGNQHAVKVGPEVFKSASEGGDTRRLVTAPDRDFLR